MTPAVQEALLEFVEAVEATGGIVFTDANKGLAAPVADEDWVDLGEAYLRACDVLGRRVKVEDA